MNSVHISVVSPVYRSEHLIDRLVSALDEELIKITPNYEIILVEDNSPDDSWSKIVDICKTNPRVKGIKLSRNFGQQNAMQAGLDVSKGDFIVTMDCDLQDRPDQIIKLYEKAKEGYDIVQARRVGRKDGFLKKLYSKIFYKVLGYLTETEQDDMVANFVLYSRKALEGIETLNDKKRYYPMLIQWVGYNSTKVDIEHAERAEGSSSYNFNKRITLALDTILNFSDKPLRLSVNFGIIISLIAILLAIRTVVMYFSGDITVEGWTSLAILITFFSGVIISVLGLIGLYVGRIFESVKGRPSYIVEDLKNF